jgi:hypothetical protein
MDNSGYATLFDQIFVVNMSTFNFSGGKVNGNLGAMATKTGGANVVLSGDISGDMQMYLTQTGGVAISTMTIVRPLTLEKPMKIRVDSNTAGQVIGKNMTHADKQYFTSAVDTLQVVFTQDKGMQVAAASEVWYCECGGKAVGAQNHVCYDIKWQAWESTTALPTTTGNYYLTNTVDLASQTQPGAAADIKLDLNGQTVNSAKRVYVFTGAKVSICNTGSQGGIVSTRSIDQGCVFWASSGAGRLALYGVNVDVVSLYQDNARICIPTHITTA